MKAFAYLRTSSATNVGEDKDSDVRQRLAIHQYADRHGIEIVAEYYDAAVKGTDHIQSRPGFSAMLDRIAANGVRTILVESAHRFARDLMVQEAGYAFLSGLDVSVVPVDAPEYFAADSDPMRTAIRQILGVIAQLDKSMTVAKLKAARDRKAAATGIPCGGRPLAPDAARKLARALHSEGKSLRAISAALAEQGHYAPSGAAYGAESVKRMLRPD